jgi:hypothetical protein
MITTELKESKERLENLNKAFNEVEPDFIDTIICLQLAEESRFNSLLRIARKEG